MYDRKVFSYDTHVANIEHQNKVVKAFGWYSETTTRHINHVADVLGYRVEGGQKGGNA